MSLADQFTMFIYHFIALLLVIGSAILVTGPMIVLSIFAYKILEFIIGSGDRH